MAKAKITPFPHPFGGLIWPKLIPGKLVKRYKRFLADVKLDSGEIVTAHCSNSGTMKACSEPGRPVYLTYHDHPGRKLKYTWEIIRMPTSLVGVNTLVPNRLLFSAVKEGAVRELSGYGEVKSEVNSGSGSRIDLLLTHFDRPPCYIEIKNCTLVTEGLAKFPDAVTQRGRKHLIELQRLVSEGCRAVMFYLIQRMDAETFAPADDIDPAYGRELRHAVKSGVEVLAYDVGIDLEKIVLNRRIPLRL